MRVRVREGSAYRGQCCVLSRLKNNQDIGENLIIGLIKNNRAIGENLIT